MADLAADLTAGQLTEFRENWIRDKYVAAAVGPPAVDYVALSEYNRSRKANFFSDSQIEAAYDRIVTEWKEELAGVQYEKEEERLAEGDSAAAATTAGDLTREQAFLRLLRVWCRKQMMEDPGFRASMVTGDKGAGLDAILKEWRAANTADAAWVMVRSGRFNEIEVERG